jgi:hypothetical protein
MKKIGQLNIRTDIELLASFTGIAEQMGQTPSTLAVNVIKDFVQIYHYKIQRGDISLSKPILKKIFETIDPKRIDEIAEFTSNFIITEIRQQEGKLTYEIILEHFIKWNKGRIQFNRIHQDDSDMIVAKHGLCRTWSEMQCKTYAKCFELVGETIRGMGFDSEDSYYIEVVRHSNS